MPKGKRIRQMPTGKRFEGHFPERVILHCFSDEPRKDRFHYVIWKDGTIEKCLDDNTQGNHTPYCNYRSLGICLEGSRFFTPEQIDSMIELADKFREEYGIPTTEWFGSYEYDLDDDNDDFGLDMRVFRHRLLTYFMKGGK